MNYKHSQKGISLIFSIFILTFVLGIALGGATILVRQMKITRDIGYSVIAFYAADSGIEEVLFKDRDDPSSVPDDYHEELIFSNGAKYIVDVTKSGGDVTIKSEGTYKNTSRAIEIVY